MFLMVWILKNGWLCVQQRQLALHEIMALLLKQELSVLMNFWDLYSRQFQPPITEAVLLAGRNPQQQEVENALVSGKGIQRCKGDSLEEVLGFLCATIRSASESLQPFLKARTLIIQTEEAARRLQNNPNLLFAVRGSAKDSAGMLADRHRVIVPVGRDDIRSASAIALLRPTVQEMGEALQTIGVSPERGLQLAHECGKSVTVLAVKFQEVVHSIEN